jgi:hypothetical protein
MPLTVAARSKALIVFTRSNAGIVGSNPPQGMNVCVVVYIGTGFATGLSLMLKVLASVYK